LTFSPTPSTSVAQLWHRSLGPTGAASCPRFHQLQHAALRITRDDVVMRDASREVGVPSVPESGRIHFR